MNSKPSERIAVVGVIHAAEYADGDHLSDYVEIGQFFRFLAIVAVGAMDSGSTVDAKLIGYTDDAGGGAADISGAAITTLEEADAQTQAMIDLDVDALAGSGKTHFKLSVTVAAGPVNLNALIIGFDPRYAPTE